MALAQNRTNSSQGLDGFGYPAGYFESTEGSFADEPLERPAALPLEKREFW